MPKYIEAIQDAAESYQCEWSDLPSAVRQEICAEQWRETPYLEPFEDWTTSRANYVWRDLIADAIKAYRSRGPQSAGYYNASAALAEAILSHAVAWSEKQAEDDYHHELDKEPRDEAPPVPVTDFVDVQRMNGGRA